MNFRAILLASHRVIFILFSLMVVTVFASDRMNDFNNLREGLKAVSSAYAAGAKAEAARTLAELSDRDDPIEWIKEVPSDSWVTPSQERLERIAQINQAIAGFEGTLVEMAFDKDLNGVAKSSARKFIYYAPPSPQLKTTLLSKAGENSEAYRLLFETGLFGSDVRSKYVEGLSASASPSIREQRADMAVDWGLIEAVPVYLEMLQKPFDPQTITFVEHIPAEDAKSALGSYKVAAQAAMYLGASGMPLLPLIKQRYSEIQAAFPDKGQVLTGNLKAAIDVLEGRRNPPVRTAISGRGEINLTKGYAPIAHHADATPIALTPAPTVNASTPSAIASTPEPSPVVRSEPSKSSPLPWIIGAILLLAVVGGILFKFLRK